MRCGISNIRSMFFCHYVDATIERNQKTPHIKIKSFNEMYVYGFVYLVNYEFMTMDVYVVVNLVKYCSHIFDMF